MDEGEMTEPIAKSLRPSPSKSPADKTDDPNDVS